MNHKKVLQIFHTLIITGASSGIGKSFLKHELSMDSSVEIFNLSRQIPEGIITQAGRLALQHISCDLADRISTDNAIGELLAKLEAQGPKAGRILLINNSGVGSYGPFPEPGIARNLEMLDINVRAPVLLTEKLLPLLRARGGAIINIASTAAFQPTAYMSVYGATKAFILNWSLALREELRGSGIHVLAVCPGPTSTQFFRNAGMEHAFLPDSLGQTSEEVVATALRALAAEKGLVVSGWKNKISAFVASKLPKVFAARVAAWVVARFRPVKDKVAS